MEISVFMSYNSLIIFFDANEVPEDLIFNYIQLHTLQSNCESEGTLTQITVHGDYENLYNLLFDLTPMSVNYFIKIF